MRCVVSNLFLESMGRFSVAVRLSDSRFFLRKNRFEVCFESGNEICMDGSSVCQVALIKPSRVVSTYVVTRS